MTPKSFRFNEKDIVMLEEAKQYLNISSDIDVIRHLLRMVGTTLKPYQAPLLESVVVPKEDSEEFLVDPLHAARKLALQNGYKGTSIRPNEMETPTVEPIPHKSEEIDLDKLSLDQKRASLKRSHPNASEKQIDYFMTLALDQDGNLIYE